MAATPVRYTCHNTDTQEWLIDGSSTPLEPYGPQQTTPEKTVTALGKPCQKRTFLNIDSLVTILSICCLILGIVAVGHNGVSWYLRSNRQIIVVGFVLGIMNLCLQTTLPYALLLTETRFGERRLQNYEAILTKSFLGAHISPIWRVSFVLLIALPLGLSVAYKRFLGGYTSLSFESSVPGDYGLDFPRIGNWAPTNDAIYFLITSMGAFRSAATPENNNTFPAPDRFPVAYGYNTLLLSEHSAAILDFPTATHLSNIQSRILPSEDWNVTSSVNAYIATYNGTTPELRQDDSYWESIISGNMRLDTMYLYDDKVRSRIGLYTLPDISGCWFGYYPNSEYYGDLVSYSQADDLDVRQFRAYANLYSIRRIRCRATWHVNTTSIVLNGGSCDTNAIVADGWLQAPGAQPFFVDVLPQLQHIYDHDNYENLVYSTWLNSTYAVSMVSAYWSRVMQVSDLTSSWSYPVSDEHIVSTRPTLRADPWLYVVLSVQPLISVGAFLITIWLHKVPVGRGFGITSILAGFDVDSQSILRGAAFSGTLKGPVKLEISQRRIGQHDAGCGLGQSESSQNRQPLRYNLSEMRTRSMERRRLDLAPGFVYR